MDRPSVKWYGSARWRRYAQQQLREHPLCVMCLQRGEVTPATITDHVIPHKDDYQAFFFGELQSLCGPHHKSTKAIEEINGYQPDIGLDGYPLDKRHPLNQFK